MAMPKLPTFLLLDPAIDRHPPTVVPNASLTEVIDIMGQATVEDRPSLNGNGSSHSQSSAEKHCSCVLVVDNSQLVGILTERDIVRLIAEHRSLVNLTVADVMSRQLVTLQAKDNLNVFSALNLMRHHQIRHLPVVSEQGQVLGLLTPKRLRRLLEPADLMRIRQVQETMNTDVIHALVSDTVLQLTEMMTQHQVSCVVIVEPAADASDALCPIGIVTERDIVQFQRLGLNLGETPAQTVMSTPLSLVRPEDSLWSVHKRMQHHKVRRLVVADRQGTLQGIVTQSHLLPVDPAELYEVLDLLQQEVSQLKAEKQNLLEQRNQELETEQKLFFSQSLDLFCVAGLDGYFKRLNPSFERVLGFSATEMMAKPFLDFIHPEDRAATVKEVERLAAGGITVNFENRYRCRDGSYRWFRWTATPYLDQQVIYATGRDVSDRKQMVYALAQKAKQQATVAQMGQLALAARDLAPFMEEVVDAIASTLNVEYCKILELLPDGESLLLKAGVGWQSRLVGEAVIGTEKESQAGYTLQSVHPVIVEDLSTETRFNGPALLRDHNVISGMSVIIQGLQRPFGILGAHSTEHRLFSENDIDFLQSMANLLAQAIEQAQANQVLRQSETDYRTLTENLPGIVYRVFPEEQHRMAFLNNQCQTLTGYSVEELASGEVCSIDPLIVLEDRSHVIATVQEAVSHQQPFLVEYRIKDSADNIRYFWEKGQPIPAQEGQPLHIDGVIFDITDRKQAELAQLATQQHLNSIMDSLQDVVWSTDPHSFEVLYLSPAAEAVYGRPVSAFYEHPEFWIQVVHPDDQSRVHTFMETLLEAGQTEMEYRILRPDGSIRWILDRARVIYGANDEVLRLDGVASDITERILAQQKVQEQAALLDIAADAILVHDLEGALSFWNHGAEIMYGWSSAEALGHNIHQLLRTRFPQHLEDIYSQLLRDLTWQGEVSHTCKDGTVLIIQCCWSLQPSLEDQPAIVLETNRDITAYKQALRQVQEQAALLDITTDAIIVRSIDSRILFWNQGAEALYGWTAAEALGQNVDQLLYQEGEAQLEEIRTAILKQGNWQGELQQITKAAQNLTVDSRWTLVYVEDDRPQSILTVNTNITEQKQLEAQFLRAQRLESIGTLASGIAHDLNNILTPIYGVAQLLPMQLPNASEQIQHQFEMLQVCAQRGSKLVSQVLSFSRGIEGEQAILPIKPLLTELKDFARKTFPQAIEISMSIPEDLWSIKGDAMQIHQVFMNLFVNARDAMPDGGALSVQAGNLTLDETFAANYLEAQVGPYILVTVADTGSGISAELLDRIFEPFFTTKKPEGGTGLGLSTVNTILKSHGGFITVYSEVGQGTQFKIYLPAIESESSVEEAELEYPAGQGELVLVVDDEAPIREVAKSILENHNYQVLVAEDGIDAIAQYAQYQMDITVVLMDMKMPALSGEMTIKTLQKINPQLKVIVTSGLLVDQQLAASIGESVKGFLQKPYSSAALLRALHNILDVESENLGGGTL